MGVDTLPSFVLACIWVNSNRGAKDRAEKTMGYKQTLSRAPEQLVVSCEAHYVLYAPLLLLLCMCVCVCGWTSMVRRNKRGTFQRKSLESLCALESSTETNYVYLSLCFFMTSFYLTHMHIAGQFAAVQQMTFCSWEHEPQLLLLCLVAHVWRGLRQSSFLSVHQQDAE